MHLHQNYLILHLSLDVLLIKIYNTNLILLLHVIGDLVMH